MDTRWSYSDRDTPELEDPDFTQLHLGFAGSIDSSATARRTYLERNHAGDIGGIVSI